MATVLRTLFLSGLILLSASNAQAQIIYPLTKTEILKGAKFDLKVEFPGAPAAPDITVTINGQPASEILGKMPTIIEKEDDGPYTAYWIRNVILGAAGTYTIKASAAGQSASAQWTVFETAEGRKARNVILFIGDGLSMAHRTAARILSKGIVEGRYGGELAIDDMPYMALVSTAGTDSVITDSANSMSAYTTGHKTCVNAMGLYCSSSPKNASHPLVETISELLRRKTKMAVGIVTNTEIEDATPAAVFAHARWRSDYDAIVRMLFGAKPDVVLGGGRSNFLQRSLPTEEGGTRSASESEDFIAKFKDAGYAFSSTNAELSAEAAKPSTKRLLGLFNDANIDGVLDRKYLHKGTVGRFPDQPDLTDEIKAALDVLSRHDDGFFLMVESGRIDKYSHSLDWERAVYETIMLDNAVTIAKQFADARNDTLVIVVADHSHPVSIVGTYDDDAPGTLLRAKLMTYDKARFPNYPSADASGYPPNIDVSRRLAFVFATYPDSCETGKPHLAGENLPAMLGPDGKTYVANEDNCQPTAVRRPGNLPFTAEKGVHSGDDVVLTAMGPGAEMFHGRIDNTRVFRVMATALGLGP